MVKWGVQLVASEPPQAPGYYNSSRRCISICIVTIKISNLTEYGWYMLYNPEYKAATLFPLRYFESFHKIIKCNKNINKIYIATSYDASNGTMSEKEQWLTSN